MKTHYVPIALFFGASLVLSGGAAEASSDYGTQSSPSAESTSTESPSSGPRDEAMGTGDLPGGQPGTVESSPEEPRETGSVPGEAAEPEKTEEEEKTPSPSGY